MLDAIDRIQLQALPWLGWCTLTSQKTGGRDMMLVKYAGLVAGTRVSSIVPGDGAIVFNPSYDASPFRSSDS